MRDFSDDLTELTKRVTDARGYLHIDDARERLAELEVEASKPDLWDDPKAARRVTTELAAVRDDVELIEGLEARVEDAQTLFELGREEGDESVEPEIESGIAAVRAQLDSLELRALFTGEYDERDAICQVSSGAGGTDAQDWTEMLLRMFTRWAERKGFTVELDEVNEGTEAGLSSATFTVRGRWAYGLLTGEKGVHRLIRISPFDANARRQTAFAAFDAVPALEVTELPDIDVNDLRIDTYRSSGAGGQHVNVTDSAVRITHLPTGVVVSCQNQRSQLQNRAKAMEILAARLAQLHREEQRAELERLSGEKRDVAFGSQIRTYTLAPYQLVKDERTRYESGNVQAVLDGDLDPFIEAFLQWRRTGGGTDGE
jgi:peptide chain release factor 2